MLEDLLNTDFNNVSGVKTLKLMRKTIAVGEIYCNQYDYNIAKIQTNIVTLQQAEKEYKKDAGDLVARIRENSIKIKQAAEEYKTAFNIVEEEEEEEDEEEEEENKNEIKENKENNREEKKKKQDEQSQSLSSATTIEVDAAITEAASAMLQQQQFVYSLPLLSDTDTSLQIYNN